MVIDYQPQPGESTGDLPIGKTHLRSWKQMCVEIRALEVALADKKPRGLG